jgi:pyridoxamine 5'-phosphate oxidase
MRDQVQQFIWKRQVMTANPFVTFGNWLAEAQVSEPNDPNAMTLATATPDGRPSARMVLLKGWDERGFVFYTNRGSRKSAELVENAHAALLFHWKSMRRQIRIEGVVSVVDDAQADEYFATRPRHSKIGAWASDQSRRLESRAVFEARLAETAQRFPGDDIPRPEFWSGWRVAADYFEFWQDIEYRLHDRTIFKRSGAGWEMGKLYP